MTDAWLVVVSPPIAVEPPAATTGVGHTVVASAAIAVDPPVADTTTSDASTPIASPRPRPIYDMIVVEPFPRIPFPLVRPSPPLTAPLDPLQDTKESHVLRLCNDTLPFTFLSLRACVQGDDIIDKQRAMFEVVEEVLIEEEKLAVGPKAPGKDIRRKDTGMKDNIDLTTLPAGRGCLMCTLGPGSSLAS